MCVGAQGVGVCIVWRGEYDFIVTSYAVNGIHEVIVIITISSKYPQKGRCQPDLSTVHGLAVKIMVG